MHTQKPSKTDWARIDSMRDENIDYTDNPMLEEDFFAGAVRWPGPKKQITLRLDPDILQCFREQGKGYQTTINAVLRKYMEAQKQRV